MGHSTPRAMFRLVTYFLVTLVCIPIQASLLVLRSPMARRFPLHYHRIVCRILGLEGEILGAISPLQPTLFVANHVSYLDIEVLAAAVPTCFVAKREVRDWPLVGITAEVQRTVFVDRTRRHQAVEAVNEIVNRLHGGTSVVLFAEGTSSDGNRVLPFRSALLGAVEEAAIRGGPDGILLQPMSITYTGQQGIPMGRQHRPLVAWYGDLDFIPHIKTFIERGAVDANVSYGEPVRTDGTVDRKTMTKQLEDSVRRLLATSLRGRALSTQAAE